MSSILDYGQIGSPTPINENARVSHQFAARGPDATPQHHHLFSGSPPPRTPGYELNVSLEDPFDQRDNSFIDGRNTISDLRNQFGTPSLSRRFGASTQSNTMDMSMAQTLHNTASFAGLDRQVRLLRFCEYNNLNIICRRMAGITGLWCQGITVVI